MVDLNDREPVDQKIYAVREPFSDPPIATVKRIRKVSQKHFKGFALVSENQKYLPEMTVHGLARTRRRPRRLDVEEFGRSLKQGG